MAEEVEIGGDDDLFVGEDKTLRFEILDGPPSSSSAAPVNATGWAVQFVVRKSDTSTATPIIDKAATISGTYDASRSVNTQRAVVTLTDTDMTIPARVYRYSLKRTDDANETVINYGNFKPQRATQQ